MPDPIASLPPAQQPAPMPSDVAVPLEPATLAPVQRAALEQLPNEVLVRVLHYLDDDAALTMRRTSHALAGRTVADAWLPVYIHRRIAWITDDHGVMMAIGNIRRVCGHRRAALFEQLAEHCRLLHPVLRTRAEAALDAAYPPATPAGALRRHMMRLRDAHASPSRFMAPPKPLVDGRLPAMTEILALPHAEHAALLADWLSCCEASGVRPAGLGHWPEAIEALPPAQRAPALWAFAKHAIDRRQTLFDRLALSRLQQLLLVTAQELPNSMTARAALDRLVKSAARLLTHRFWEIEDTDGDIDLAPWMVHWHALLDLIPRLSDGGAANVAPLLAEISAHPAVVGGLDDDPAPWQCLLESVKGRLSGSAIVEVFRAMATSSSGGAGRREDREGYEDMLDSMLQISKALQPADGARLKALYLTAFPYDPALALGEWQREFGEASRLEPEARSHVLTALAISIGLGDDSRQVSSRFSMVLGKVAALPAEWRLEPLLALSRHAADNRDPLQGREIIRAATALRDQDRAALIATMLAATHHPFVQLDLLNSIGLLPEAHRLDAIAAALPAIISRKFSAPDWWTRPEDNPFPASEGSAFDMLPRSREESESMASRLIDAAPAAERGGLLVKFAEDVSFNLLTQLWLLRQLDKLPARGRHSVLILTHLSYRLHAWSTSVARAHPHGTTDPVVERMCGALLDALEQEPAEQRLSALLTIVDMAKAMQSFHTDLPVRLGELVGVSEIRDARPAAGRKRKAG